MHSGTLWHEWAATKRTRTHHTTQHKQKRHFPPWSDCQLILLTREVLHARRSRFKLIESCKRAVYHILVMIAGHTHRHIEMIGWLRRPSCCEWRWWRQDRAKARCHCRSAAHWTEQTRQTEGQPDCKCLTRSTPSTAATALSAMRMCASTHPRARLAMSLSQPFTRLGLSRHWLSILHYYIASVSLYIYNIIA